MNKSAHELYQGGGEEFVNCDYCSVCTFRHPRKRGVQWKEIDRWGGRLKDCGIVSKMLVEIEYTRGIFGQ